MSANRVINAGERVIKLYRRFSTASGRVSGVSGKVITPPWGLNNSLFPLRGHAQNRNTATFARTHAGALGLGVALHTPTTTPDGSLSVKLALGFGVVGVVVLLGLLTAVVARWWR